MSAILNNIGETIATTTAYALIQEDQPQLGVDPTSAQTTPVARKSRVLAPVLAASLPLAIGCSGGSLALGAAAVLLTAGAVGGGYAFLRHRGYFGPRQATTPAITPPAERLGVLYRRNLGTRPAGLAVHNAMKQATSNPKEYEKLIAAINTAMAEFVPTRAPLTYTPGATLDIATVGIDFLDGVFFLAYSLAGSSFSYSLPGEQAYHVKQALLGRSGLTSDFSTALQARIINGDPTSNPLAQHWAQMTCDRSLPAFEVERAFHLIAQVFDSTWFHRMAEYGIDPKNFRHD